MRLPNGFGTVYKLSGKRRRPWITRVTTGWDDNGKQLYQTLGYFKSRQEGIEALTEYSKNPYSIEATKLTFADVYERWSKRKFETISHSNVNGYKAAFETSKKLHNIPFTEIKTDHMQDVVDTCGKGYGTLRKIKVLYGQLYKYAMERDIVSKDYSSFVDISAKSDERGKILSRAPFTNNEIAILWDNVGRMDFIDTVLILIYTGMRVGELLLIKNNDVNLEQRVMYGGLKTESGKDRAIPINIKILPFIEERFSKENEFLIINYEGRKMSYFNYYNEKWKKIMEQLGFEHKPHDARHTFASLMDNAGANKVSIKRIMGHSSNDITDKVYTHKDIEELIKAIDLI